MERTDTEADPVTGHTNVARALAALPSTLPATIAPPRGHCPSCGHRGVAVSALVMRAILARESRTHVRDGFTFCPTPGCPVVYHDVAAGVVLGADALNKPVGVKRPDIDAAICYCLNVARATILAAVAEGTVDTSEDAKRVTKACTGKACHIVNPAGTCCGDQLRDTVVLGLGLRGAKEDAIARAKNEDPGADCCGRTLSRALSSPHELGAGPGPSCHC